MNINKLPSQEYLNKLFRYDSDTGFLYRKTQASNRMAGEQVGSPHSLGYLRVRIDKKDYLVHRIIYKMYHGVYPHSIDYIDGDSSNNKTYNIRSVSHKQNNKNQKI